MKQRFEVYTGAEIPTIGGYLYVKSTNGFAAECDEMEVGEDGNETYTGERRLTASDIARELYAAEGRNYEVVFLEEYNGEEATITRYTKCWLCLWDKSFELRTMDNATVISSTYEAAGIDTTVEGDYEQYDDYFTDVMGFVPEYEIG